MSSGFKTELCRNYASREGCGFDVECTSAHGPVELSFYTDRENIKKLDLALPEAVEAHKNRIAEAVAQETKRSLRKLGFPIAELDGDVYKSFLCKHWVTFNDCGTCEHPDGCAACDGAHGEAELYYYSNPTHRKLLQLDTDDGLEAHRKERRDVNLYDACAEVGEVMWSRSGRGGIDYPIIAVPLRLEVMGATSTNRGGVESTTLRLSDLLAPTGPNKVAEKEISLYKTVLCPARDVGCKAGHHCDQAHSLDQVSFYTQDMKKRIGLASAEDIQAHKESMVRSQKAYNCLFVVCVSLREETDHLLEQIPVRWEEETTGKAPIAVEKMVLPVTEEEMNSVANHFKTKLCDNYKRKGSCQYGFRCRFAHGEDDLRTFGQNQRDKITSESAVREFAHNAEMKAKGLIPDSAPATTIPPPRSNNNNAKGNNNNNNYNNNNNMKPPVNTFLAPPAVHAQPFIPGNPNNVYHFDPNAANVMTGGGEDRLLPLLPSNRGGGPQPVGVPPAFPEMDFITAAPPAAADPVMNISKVLAPYVEDDKPVTHEILYRYRTEWCQDYFIYGQCPDGAHCQKAHHTSELRSEGRNREDFKMLVAAYLRAHETNMGQLRQDVGLE